MLLCLEPEACPPSGLPQWQKASLEIVTEKDSILCHLDSIWLGILLPNFNMGDKAGGLPNAYLRDRGDFLLATPQNLQLPAHSSLSLWNGRTLAQVHSLVSYLVHLEAEVVLPAPKIPTKPNENKFHVCPLSVAREDMRSAQNHDLAVILILLPVPKYRLRVLTAFSPT